MSLAKLNPCVRMLSASDFVGSATSSRFPQRASCAQWRFLVTRIPSRHGSHALKSPYVRVAHQESANNRQKHPAKQRHRPGQSHRHYHFFKRTSQSETGTKAAKLVNILRSLSNVKEEIYAALDEWLAFEVEFLKIALAKALKRLKEREQWLRIIQVSKWMWSKGHGKSFETYGLMLRAYEMDSRLEECLILWEKILMLHGNSTPKNMFVRMMHICKRQQMLGELVKVFEQMESLRIKPATDTLEMVKEAYKQMGRPEMEQTLTTMYPPKWKYLRYRERSVKVRLKPLSSTDSETGESEEGCIDSLVQT